MLWKHLGDGILLSKLATSKMILLRNVKTSKLIQSFLEPCILLSWYELQYWLKSGTMHVFLDTKASFKDLKCLLFFLALKLSFNVYESSLCAEFPSVILDGGWLSLGLLVTMLGMAGDHSGDGGVPSMSVVTCSWFFELSQGVKFQDCSAIPSGRCWQG